MIRFRRFLSDPAAYPDRADPPGPAFLSGTFMVKLHIPGIGNIWFWTEITIHRTKKYYFTQINLDPAKRTLLLQVGITSSSPDSEISCLRIDQVKIQSSWNV